VQLSYIFFSCVFFGASLCLSGQQSKEGDETRNQSSSSIRVESGRLTANFQDRPLSVVCDTIAATTHIKVVLAGGLEDDLVSLNVSSAAIDVALRELFAGYDTFVFYGGTKNVPSALRTVWVYPKGAASDVRPVPRADWAGTKELEAALADSSNEIRQAAYEALLERPDRRSRNLVLDAIRGIRERDSGVRERLLSSAISKGFPITPDVLTELARTDSAEQIRWMALDTLAFSESSSVRQVAEEAATDASEAVRLRANDILNQLRGARRPQSPEMESAATEPRQ
jgi:hypothetical protein